MKVIVEREESAEGFPGFRSRTIQQDEYEGCTAAIDEDGEAWINDREMRVIATYPPDSWIRIITAHERLL